jgi:hypothetical protein
MPGAGGRGRWHPHPVRRPPPERLRSGGPASDGERPHGGVGRASARGHPHGRAGG